MRLIGHLKLFSDNKDAVLKHAFMDSPLIMARAQSSNLRVFMIKRELLKNLNRRHEHSKPSDVLPGTI